MQATIHLLLQARQCVLSGMLFGMACSISRDRLRLIFVPGNNKIFLHWIELQRSFATRAFGATVLWAKQLTTSILRFIENSLTCGGRSNKTRLVYDGGQIEIRRQYHRPLDISGNAITDCGNQWQRFWQWTTDETFLREIEL